jgi:hypothetical protein
MVWVERVDYVTSRFGGSKLSGSRASMPAQARGALRHQDKCTSFVSMVGLNGVRELER